MTDTAAPPVGDLLDEDELDPLRAALEAAYTGIRLVAAGRFRARSRGSKESALTAANGLVDASDWRATLEKSGVLAAIEDVVLDTVIGLRLSYGVALADAVYEAKVDAAQRGIVAVGEDVGARIREWVTDLLHAGFTGDQVAAALASELSIDDVADGGEFMHRDPRYAIRVLSFARRKPLTRMQARALARAQATSAANAAIEVGVAIAGYPYKRWNTVGDDRVRDAHEAVSDEAIPVNEAFSVGGYSAMHPHDWNLPIELRANCRCWLTAVKESGKDAPAVALNMKQLRAIAADLRLPGRARMSKHELQDALLDLQCEGGGGALTAAGAPSPLVKSWCGNLRTLNRQGLIQRARVLDVPRMENGRWPDDATLRKEIQHKLGTVRGQRAATKAAKSGRGAADDVVETRTRRGAPPKAAARPVRSTGAIKLDEAGFPDQASLVKSQARWNARMRAKEMSRVFRQWMDRDPNVAIQRAHVGLKTSEKMLDWARRMNDALHSNPLADDIMVVRTEWKTGRFSKTWGRGDFAVGKTFQANTITATSINPLGYDPFASAQAVRLEILVPKGTNGGFISHFTRSSNAGQYGEYLLPAGTRFRVVNVSVQRLENVRRRMSTGEIIHTGRYANVTVVRLEVVGQTKVVF